MARKFFGLMFGLVAIAGVLAVLLYVAHMRDDTDEANIRPAPTGPVPADVLDLAHWKLVLPESKADSTKDSSARDLQPVQIRQPKLATYSDPESFFVNAAGDGVVFKARVDGATTSGSRYPRSELQEMKSDGSATADWSSNSGIHTMTITEAIAHTPEVRPQVVAGQIHDHDDDVAMIRLEKRKLFVEADGDEIGILDRDYRRGTRFTVRIEASPGGVKVTYNGTTTVKYDKTGKHWYFKAGCYTQASDHRQHDDDPDQKYDKPMAYGEVVIYSLKVTHRTR